MNLFYVAAAIRGVSENKTLEIWGTILLLSIWENGGLEIEVFDCFWLIWHGDLYVYYIRSTAFVLLECIAGN